jgi:transcriptional regulator with XRE-family HTH domain
MREGNLRRAGGRPIYNTGDRAADKLRTQMRQLGITMTELAAELGVGKSDISHALSPRARQKRYLKLRKRIEEYLKRAIRAHRQLSPITRYRIYIRALQERMPKRAYAIPDDIRDILQYAAYHNLPPPPIALAAAARILHFKSYTTLLRALDDDPKITPQTKREATRCLELYAKWLREDWERAL